MKDFFRQIKLNVLVSALLTIALGVVLIMYPGQVTILVCQIIGAILIIMGLLAFLSSFISDASGTLFMIGGIIVAIIGAFIVWKPATVASLIPIFIGIVMVIHGIQDIRLSFESKSHGYEKWWVLLLIAIITLALGTLCICSAFEMVEIGVMIIGISLVFDGISDLFVVNRVSSAAKRVKRAVEDATAVDVEFEEKDI